jgi:hypothetical protein
MRLNYRIETSRIAPFAYKTPLVEINSDGELIVKESRKKSLKTFKSITFLNLVGRDESGALQTYKPIDHVNRFLMAHHLDDDKLESEQYSKGLVHFFEYLLSAQAMWDKEFDDDLYEEGIDEPRPEWDVLALMLTMKYTTKAETLAVLREKEYLPIDLRGLSLATRFTCVEVRSKFSLEMEP